MNPMPKFHGKKPGVYYRFIQYFGMLEIWTHIRITFVVLSRYKEISHENIDPPPEALTAIY